MTEQIPDTTTPQTSQRFARLIDDESGQDIIEYALLAALIGLSGVSAMPSLATQLANTMGAVASTLNTSVPAPSNGGGGGGGDHDDGGGHDHGG